MELKINEFMIWFEYLLFFYYIKVLNSDDLQVHDQDDTSSHYTNEISSAIN